MSTKNKVTSKYLAEKLFYSINNNSVSHPTAVMFIKELIAHLHLFICTTKVYIKYLSGTWLN